MQKQNSQKLTLSDVKTRELSTTEAEIAAGGYTYYQASAFAVRPSYWYTGAGGYRVPTGPGPVGG